MNKTFIEWCDYTWNPVTGCLHGCEYCYAKRQAMRFAGFWDGIANTIPDPIISVNTTVRYGLKYLTSTGKLIRAPFPYGFRPTLYAYRLDEPARIKKPQNIFVVSMGDLFGEWVPDAWIKSVFEACNAAPQHQYLFLTKNPDRYYQLGEGDDAIIPDEGVSGWFGASASTGKEAEAAWENLNCSWMSLEPLHGDFSEEFFVHDDRYTQSVKRRWEWIVLGAESGNRKNRIIPKREWIHDIVSQCREVGTPIFMKNSLADIWGEPLIQEWPEGLKKTEA